MNRVAVLMKRIAVLFALSNIPSGSDVFEVFGIKMIYYNLSNKRLIMVHRRRKFENLKKKLLEYVYKKIYIY